jgi:hypothetical protein
VGRAPSGAPEPLVRPLRGHRVGPSLSTYDTTAVDTPAVVPESPVRAEGTFDVVGALGLTLGLTLLLLPIIKGGDWGWSSGTTLGMFAVLVVVLVVWGVLELRTRVPLVDLRTTARREVMLTDLASIMVGVAFYVVTIVHPQLLQLPTSTGYGLGQSMVVAGLCMAPLGVTMMFMTPVYSRLSARYSRDPDHARLPHLVPDRHDRHGRRATPGELPAPHQGRPARCRATPYSPYVLPMMSR